MEGGVPRADRHVPPQLRHPCEPERVGVEGRVFKESQTWKTHPKEFTSRAALTAAREGLEHLAGSPDDPLTWLELWGVGGGVGYNNAKSYL